MKIDMAAVMVARLLVSVTAMISLGTPGTCIVASRMKAISSTSCEWTKSAGIFSTLSLAFVMNERKVCAMPWNFPVKRSSRDVTASSPAPSRLTIRSGRFGCRTGS